MRQYVPQNALYGGSPPLTFRGVVEECEDVLLFIVVDEVSVQAQPWDWSTMEAKVECCTTGDRSTNFRVSDSFYYLTFGGRYKEFINSFSFSIPW